MQSLLTTIKAGQVLIGSFGYDETWYRYYSVIRRVGKTQVELQELAQRTGMPYKGETIGEPFKRKIKDQWVSIHECEQAYIYHGDFVDAWGDIV